MPFARAPAAFHTACGGRRPGRPPWDLRDRDGGAPSGRRGRWEGEGELLPPPGLTFSLGTHTSFQQQLPASQHSPGFCRSRRAGGGRPGVRAGV